MFYRLQIEIVSGLYEDFINYLVENEFFISSIESTQFGVTLNCYASDYYQIAKSARKYQCRTRIVQKKGIYFYAKKYIPRKSIVISVCMVFLYFFVFGKIIWKIDVISPSSQINNGVYNLLYQNSVYTGTIFSQEKNQNIIQQIFMQVEDVGYVTMNFYKGVLTCKVDPIEEKENYTNILSLGNITATQNGVIHDLHIYNGFSDIKTGQTVEKGQILVSSTYIDRNGKLHQVIPRAYIKALCIKKYTAQVELNKAVYLRTGEKESDIYLKCAGANLKIRKANLSDYNNYDTEKAFSYCDILGFKLPITTEKTTYYKKEQFFIEKDENTAVNAAKSIIDTLIENDESLETIEEKNYDYTIVDNMITMICTVQGYYDITK